MTNEIGINWKGSISEKAPLFQIPNESELNELFSESMALYGEACYVQEAYEEYITEASSDDSEKEPKLRKLGLMIKSLIDRFIRALKRFMTNQTCKKAIKFFSDKFNLTYVLTQNKDEEHFKELTSSVATFSRLLEITNRFESNKLKDLTVGDIFNNLPSMQKSLTKAFGEDGFFTCDNMKHIIYVMEREKVRYTASIETVDQERIIDIYTAIIKKFATLQTDFIDAYKYFSDMKEKSKSLGK